MIRASHTPSAPWLCAQIPEETIPRERTLEIWRCVSLAPAPAAAEASRACVGGEDSAGGEGVGVPLTVL